MKYLIHYQAKPKTNFFLTLVFRTCDLDVEYREKLDLFLYLLSSRLSRNRIGKREEIELETFASKDI